ncbi:MAG: SAM-dependent chlorinase/fluorinase [Erysipelotrichaceae bacterium]|nr:SAM-dependent chlorinase/fluorinase [Erysipelotrichaceae bacterium]
MKKLLVFQTDFTYAEGAVAAMYGVVKSVDPMLEIIDATHEIPQYDIFSASYRLYQYVPFWPEETVFVSVVDPGVGTSRKACVAELSNGAYLVTPDNGTLTHIARNFGIRKVRQIDEKVNRLRGKNNEDVAVFHGRDLFGYCAARLASGIISYEEVGPEYPLDQIVTFDLPEASVSEKEVKGILEINDPNFGNLWTNIPIKLFKECGFDYGNQIETVICHDDEEVFHENLPFYQTFSLAEDHSVMIYHNELNKVALAEVVGNLAKDYNLGYGPAYRIGFRRKSNDE